MITDAMRLAGYSEYDITSKKKTAQKAVGRWIKKKEAADKAADKPAEFASCPLPFIDVNTEIPKAPLISPLSSSQGSSTYTKTSNETSSTHTKTSNKTSSSSSKKTNQVTVNTLKKGLASDFSRLTTLPEKRRSSEDAQAARAEEKMYEDAKRMAFMCGTIMLHAQRSGRFELKHFKDGEQIAEKLNNMFEYDAISGEDLCRGVRNGHVGVPPPRQGKQSRIDDDDFEKICDLVSTCQSIEQANCDANRLDRPRMRSAIMEIVNDMLTNSNQDPLSAVNFFKRIEKELAREFKLTSPNYREALRAAWLTYNNQNDNYTQWEFWLVSLGFGRFSKTDKEKAENGNVTFHEGQQRRILQFDEMGFSLDGKKNGKGGRPAAVASNKNIPEPDQPTNKSNHKVTCLCGMNYMAEALPPLFVLSSAAKEPKLKTRLILEMKQVKGVYGFREERAFPPHIAFAKDGSVDTNILRYYMENLISTLYPDAADEPGKRVLIKCDLGPGRWDAMFRTVGRSLGVYVFPGVPNGTELGQEMDQLFSYFKTLMETNREQLWNARYRFFNSKAKTTSWDLGLIVFGGEVTLPNGDRLQLRNAFNESFSRSKLQRAMKKCGYVPATRVLLTSEKLVREIIDGDDEYEEATSKQDYCHTKMLLAIEKKNHETVKELIKRGYLLAENLKRHIRRSSKQKSLPDADDITTEPGTRSRQKRLIGTRQGGEWFRRTNGGAPLNCDDAIIALEMEYLEGKRKNLEKLKKQSSTRQKEINDAKAIIEKKGKDYNAKFKQNKAKTNYIPNWTLAEMKAMIKWKSPKHPNIPTSRESLESVWEDVKDVDPPQQEEELSWQQQQEDALKEFENNGMWTIERTYVMRRAEQRRKETLAAQLRAAQPKNALKVMGHVLQSLPRLQQQEFIESWNYYTLDDDYSQSTVLSVGDLDNDSLHTIDDYDSDDESCAVVSFPSQKQSDRREDSETQSSSEEISLDSDESKQDDNLPPQQQHPPQQQASIPSENPVPLRRSSRQRNQRPPSPPADH